MADPEAKERIGLRHLAEAGRLPKDLLPDADVGFAAGKDARIQYLYGEFAAIGRMDSELGAAQERASSGLFPSSPGGAYINALHPCRRLLLQPHLDRTGRTKRLGKGEPRRSVCIRDSRHRRRSRAARSTARTKPLEL